MREPGIIASYRSARGAGLCLLPSPDRASRIGSLARPRRRERFVDAYEASGGGRVDEALLRVVAACEAFA
jgi:hypothetical protein